VTIDIPLRRVLSISGPLLTAGPYAIRMAARSDRRSIVTDLVYFLPYTAEAFTVDHMM
jgi:hypothetical protein